MVWSECTDSFQMQPVYEVKTYNFRENILRDILLKANIISPPKTSHEVGGKLGRGAIRSYARKGNFLPCFIRCILVEARLM